MYVLVQITKSNMHKLILIQQRNFLYDSSYKKDIFSRLLQAVHENEGRQRCQEQDDGLDI